MVLATITQKSVQHFNVATFKFSVFRRFKYLQIIRKFFFLTILPTIREITLIKNTYNFRIKSDMCKWSVKVNQDEALNSLNLAQFNFFALSVKMDEIYFFNIISNNSYCLFAYHLIFIMLNLIYSQRCTCGDLYLAVTSIKRSHLI